MIKNTKQIHDSREKEIKTPPLSIHDSRKKGISNWSLSKKIILFYQNNKKTILTFSILILILIILIFPKWSAILIGNWIKNFLGTIINIVKTI